MKNKKIKKEVLKSSNQSPKKIPSNDYFPFLFSNNI